MFPGLQERQSALWPCRLPLLEGGEGANREGTRAAGPRWVLVHWHRLRGTDRLWGIQHIAASRLRAGKGQPGPGLGNGCGSSSGSRWGSPVHRRTLGSGTGPEAQSFGQGGWGQQLILLLGKNHGRSFGRTVKPQLGSSWTEKKDRACFPLGGGQEEPGEVKKQGWKD